MEILALKTIHKSLYSASAKKVDLVDVPRLNFLRLDGAIEAGQAPATSPGFQENVQALYGAAYTLKFMLKKRMDHPIDYPVMPLEGLWWVEDGKFDISIQDNWFYTVMILQPDVITSEVFAEGLENLRKKKGDQAIFHRLRLAPFEEGWCIQTLHLGRYAEEPATLERMNAHAAAEGLHLHHAHHEIYLNDPLKTAAANLKTILRHPVTR